MLALYVTAYNYSTFEIALVLVKKKIVVSVNLYSVKTLN